VGLFMLGCVWREVGVLFVGCAVGGVAFTACGLVGGAGSRFVWMVCGAGIGFFAGECYCVVVWKGIWFVVR